MKWINPDGSATEIDVFNDPNAGRQIADKIAEDPDMQEAIGDHIASKIQEA